MKPNNKIVSPAGGLGRIHAGRLRHYALRATASVVEKFAYLSKELSTNE